MWSFIILDGLEIILARPLHQPAWQPCSLGWPGRWSKIGGCCTWTGSCKPNLVILDIHIWISVWIIFHDPSNREL